MRAERSIPDVHPAMRLLPALAVALCIAPALAQDAPVQDRTQAFTGSGATEAQACAAARAEAQAWVKRGKADGRRRDLVRSGDCACTPADGQATCRLDAQVRDEAFEEEEER